MATNELRWKCVAYHQRDRLLAGGQIEDVIAREALKECRFAHRYSAIFLRMKEATFGREAVHFRPRYTSAPWKYPALSTITAKAKAAAKAKLAEQIR